MKTIKDIATSLLTLNDIQQTEGLSFLVSAFSVHTILGMLASENSDYMLTRNYQACSPISAIKEIRLVSK